MFPFFAGDVARYLAAICLFWLVIVPPGFVIGWVANPFGFREGRPLFRLYAATALGVSITPILIYLCWRLGSSRVVWLLYAVLWTAFAVLLLLRKLRLPDLIPPRAEFLLAAGWIALAGLLVLDLRIGDDVYFNWASLDHSFRISVIQSIRHTTTLPPSNPFFYPGHPVPFRYHYFWFMLAAFVQAVGGGLITARDALFASIVWCGLAIVAVFALFLPSAAETSTESSSHQTWRRQTWIAAGLLSITGLDLLPDGLITLLTSQQHRRFYFPFGDFETWNADGQITSWLGSLIWVPNHVGGLVCGCTALLLLLWAWRTADPRGRISFALLSGLAFGSAAGCSIYVVFVFVLGLAAMFVAALLRKSWGRAIILALTGVTALIAALPYLAELRAAADGIPFAVLRLRSFGPAFWFVHQTPGALNTPGAAVLLLCLPLNFALELGFFAAIAFYKWKRRRIQATSETGRAMLYMLASGLFIGSFLASVTLSHNDLGWRAMLVPQFILLLWAVEWTEEALLPAWRSRTLFKGSTGFLVALAFIGIAGTVYDAVLLRFYSLAIDHNRAESGSPVLTTGVGERTAELRQIYIESLKSLPDTALVQESPMVPDATQQGIYSSWASAARGRLYGPFYGGDPALYARNEAALDPLFEQSATVAYAAQLCADPHFGAFVVQDFDPTWHQSNSWIWTTPPTFAGNRARAFTCAQILHTASAQPQPQHP
jgi:hypothetical protein